MTPADLSLPDRILTRLRVTPDGCWVWTGFCNPKGYGQTWLTDRVWLVHRLTWVASGHELTVDGLGFPHWMLDHLCRVPPCANPAHLQLVTARENTQRGAAGINHASVTHCPQGHEYSPENTRIRKGKHRTCRTCANAQRRRRQAARRLEAGRI